MNLAFLGLGNMGTPMALHLLRAGHSLTVYNRTPQKAAPLTAEGATLADSPAAAVKNAGVVFTMVADDSAATSLVLGEQGVASALQPGAIHISSSTISTSLSRHFTEEHARRNQLYLSAPVFGRPEAAQAKKLVVIPAGPADLIARCQPLFDALGRATFTIGPEPWQANAAKLCGNFMIIAVIEAFAEAYAALRKAGVDPHKFLEVMSTLTASPLYSTYGAIIANEAYTPPGFPLRLGLKDVRLILANAEECQTPMPIASVLRDQFLAALAHGQSELDWSSVAKVAARNAGLES